MTEQLQPETKPLERRAHDAGRVSVETLVEICGNEPGIPAFEAETVDVSARGMHLRTAYLPEQGAPLVCRFEDHGREIVVEGLVAWRREGTRGGEFGVEFTALDARSVDALRELCAGHDGAAETGDAAASDHVAGTRVRLHIEGLGSPMKARVRGVETHRVQVGSNLEFLKVGRRLEVEDLERGGRKTAQIDAVSVAVDPQTQVPQLVVALRFEGAEDTTPEPSVADLGQAGAAARTFSIPVESVTTDAAADSPVAPPAGAAEGSPAPAYAQSVETEALDEDAEARALRGRLGSAATSAGEAAKVASQRLATLGSRAGQGIGRLFKDAGIKVAELARRQREKKPVRRTTAPAHGPVSIDKQRLRPQSQAAPESAKPEPALAGLRKLPRSKLALGAGAAVLALSAGALALKASSAPPPGAVAAPEGSVVAVVGAAPPAFPEAPAAESAGGVTANVPLFGPTPMATMEPVPLAPPPAGEEAAERAEAEASEPGDESWPESGATAKPAAKDAKSAPRTKPEDVAPWGRGKMNTPTVHRLRLDGPGSALQGALQPTGFLVVVPGRKLMEHAGAVAKRDARFAQVKSVNTPNGAQITFKFKDSIPGYRVRLRRDYVEFLISAETKPAKTAAASPAKGKAATTKIAKKK
jgi:hypothetical protein